MDIISMAQQASPNDIGQIEFLRAQLMAASSVVRTMPSEASGGGIVSTSVVDAGKQFRGAAGEGFIHTLLFSHGPPVEYELISDKYDEVLDRAAAALGDRSRISGTSGDASTSRPPKPSRRSCARMGVDTASAEAIEQAIAEREQKASRLRLVPPCLVISENTSPRARFRSTRRPASYGRDHHHARGWRGNRTARLRRRCAPAICRWAITMWRSTVDGQRASMRLIVTPDRAYAPRRARGWTGGGALRLALGAQLGLRRFPRPGGAERLGRAATLGASFIALNPLHAIHNRRPFNTSPYLPNCVFYQNFLYLDVEAIEDFQQSPRAQRLWRDPAVQAEVAALRASEQVEYERVWRH